uniref:Uncharacterized protein n=1 Tax=Oryza rufipogon TaxID=4529 RepID=A0A0E0Q7V7_ORYRU
MYIIANTFSSENTLITKAEDKRNSNNEDAVYDKEYEKDGSPTENINVYDKIRACTHPWYTALQISMNALVMVELDGETDPLECLYSRNSNNEDAVYDKEYEKDGSPTENINVYDKIRVCTHPWYTALQISMNALVMVELDGETDPLEK